MSQIRMVEVKENELDPKRNYECVLTLPFESIVMREQWVDWWVKEGRLEFLQFMTKQNS